MKSHSTLSIFLLSCLTTSGTVNAGLPWSKKATGSVTVKPPTQSMAPGSEGIADASSSLFPFGNLQDSALVTTLKDATSPDNISVLSGSAALGIGLGLIAIPGVTSSAFGMGEIEEDSLSSFFCQMLGSVEVGAAITIAALASDTPVARAVGLGMVPRILVGAKLLLTGSLEKVGFVKTNRIIAKIAMGSAATFSMISGCGNPNTTMKVISALEVICAIIANCKPSKLLKSTTIDIDSEENVQAKAIMKATTQELLGHGVYIGCLANGVAPAKALGWYAASASAAMASTVASKDFFYGDLGVTKKAATTVVIAGAVLAMRLLSDE